MKKNISVSYRGQLAKVAEFTVSRLLPNRYTDAVGPFVFLDYLLPTTIQPKTPDNPGGEAAHPHRGIATFSYLFSGELEHFDSKGHQGTVGPGGAQWMKAGNGIIHDENPTKAFQESGGVLHGLQFWINLPAKVKAEAPDYLALHATDVPEIALPANAGTLRVLIGEYNGKTSPVKTFSPQFNYHIKLNPGSLFELNANRVHEYAAFIPVTELQVNGSTQGKGELLIFESAGDLITFENKGTDVADIIVFGGEPYTEPIYAEGPFVMNTELEVAYAYRDYFNGKYGQIDYAR